MAEFIDAALTQEVVDAKNELQTQAERARTIVDYWDGFVPSTVGGGGGGSGGIPEAPVNGVPYARKDEAWSPVDAVTSVNGKTDTVTLTTDDISDTNNVQQFVTASDLVKLGGIAIGAQVNKFDYSDAPSNSIEYVRKNNAWVNSTSSGGIPEAPIDGNAYSRKDAAWAVAAGSGAPSVSSLQNTYDNSIAPQIVTSTTLGAVTTKRGSTADTDVVTQVQNGAGTVVHSVTGEGDVNYSDATVQTTAFTDTLKTKLDSVTSGATPNSSDATLLARVNHTGAQLASTISDLSTAVAGTASVIANTNKNTYPAADAAKVATVVADAPSDGSQYSRKDGVWSLVESGGVSYDTTFVSYTKFLDFSSIAALGVGEYTVASSTAVGGHLPHRNGNNVYFVTIRHDAVYDTYLLTAKVSHTKNEASMNNSWYGKTWVRSVEAIEDKGWYAQTGNYYESRSNPQTLDGVTTFSDWDDAVNDGILVCGDNYMLGNSIGITQILSSEEVIMRFSQLNERNNDIGLGECLMEAIVIGSLGAATTNFGKSYIRRIYENYGTNLDTGWIQKTGA